MRKREFDHTPLSVTLRTGASNSFRVAGQL
jgi:hypothetical protein